MSRFAKLKKIGWILFGLFLLMFFSIGKIPEQKIRAWVEGSLNGPLAERGMQLKVSESYLSTLTGLQFVMKNVFLTLPPPSPQLKFDLITVSPLWLSFLSGKQGAQFKVESAGGTLSGSASGKLEKNVFKDFSIDLNLDKWNLGKTGTLEILSGVRGNAILSGNFNLAGDAVIPSTWKGDAKLNLQNISLDQQTIQPMPGFSLSLPEIKTATGAIDLIAAGGGVQIKTLSLGKPNSSDDLVLSGTGDIVLGKSLVASTIKAKTQLSFSPNVTKSVGFLEMAMAQAKQIDGSFAYEIKGELLAPQFLPVTQKYR